MSTPDQPSTPPLTRKQLRELRNTGATPVVVPNGDPEAAEPQSAPAATPETPVAPAPLPRAAVPVDVHTAPVPDAAVDLGASPLTRRQARQQERIRTASVPVITPDVSASAASVPSAVTVIDPSPATPDEKTAPEAKDRAAEPEVAGQAAPVEDAAPATDAATDALLRELNAEPDEDVRPDESPAAAAEQAPEPIAEERAVLNPMFGAGLLAGKADKAESASSFEQLLGRDVDTTGSVSAPSALIMSHASAAPLVGPIGGTGEVLVTGTFALPEGLGSTGHALGTADGREIDAVLVDGELPAHSSPTPIAASAAVSTIKTSQDIIQPPTPEKSGRLMLTLAITAGVLALALVGVLVYALASGVIS